MCCVPGACKQPNPLRLHRVRHTHESVRAREQHITFKYFPAQHSSLLRRSFDMVSRGRISLAETKVTRHKYILCNAGL